MPGPVQPIVATDSPVTFRAPSSGSLILSAASPDGTTETCPGVQRIEFTRDGERWLPVGAHAGMFAMAEGDQMRIACMNPRALQLAFAPLA